MRTFFLWMGLIFVSVQIQAQVAGSRANGFADSKVQYGQTIEFQVPHSAILDTSNIQSVKVEIYKRLLNPPEVLSMKREKEAWHASYTLSDTSVKTLFYTLVFQKKTGEVYSEEKLWDILVVDALGRPVLGAHQAKALSYTGISEKRAEDLSQALIEIDTELRFYPENFSARALKYQILLKQHNFSKPVRVQIISEIDSLLANAPKTDALWAFATEMYQMLGEKEKAQKAEKEWISQNPQGDRSASVAFSKILEIENPYERMKQLENFLLQFPHSRLVEPALAQMATSAIQVGDTLRMIQIGDQLLEKANTLAGANALAGLAGVLGENGAFLDRSQAYIQKAFHILRSAQTGTETPPEELSLLEARYRDVWGWILFQKGSVSEALQEFKEAEKQTLQGSLFYHLGMVYDRSRDFSQAEQNLARAVAFGGPYADMARKALVDLWTRTGKDTLFLEDFVDAQAQWLEARSKEKILSGEVDLSAPDFHLEDLEGGHVRLSDQKGNVVLLCFWGTWSKASISLLEALRYLLERYGEEVLFLTIAMDTERATVQRFVTEKRFPFTVLLNDQTEKLYQLEGVPALYVIDKKGHIRFMHKGYRKDIVQILSIELDYLLGAHSP